MHSIMVEDPFISRAALFSARRFALAGCYSPYSGHAYINHSKAVAMKVARFTQSKNLLACAWLHSNLSFQFTDSIELHDEFGEGIAKMIDQIASFNVPLTAEPKALANFDCDAMTSASGEVQTLVLAELIILGETLRCHHPSQLEDFLFWLNVILKAFPDANSNLLEEVRRFVDVNQPKSVTH